MPDAETERQAVRLFEELLQVPERERDAWMARVAADRPDLLTRLQALREADRLATLRTGAAAEAFEGEEEVAAPERIGSYRVLERIGRGGMGSVYRAERATGDFAHVVAIKIIKPGLLSHSLVDRFQRERQLLARLSHPNIARLYDGGEIEGGSPYIVMEYVEGLPLLQMVEEQRLSRGDRLRLFADICGAVAFAHRHLVVHRDLTPSNILVTPDRVVKLIDFGIARPPDVSGDLTPGTSGGSVASLSLTPGYAAPERTTSTNVTTAADIYSLGRLIEKLIVPDRQGRELQAIAAKATAQDPGARYPTAEALGADVQAWQNNLPVEALGGGKRYRARKFVTRHRLEVAAAASAILLLVAALTITLLANSRAEQARAQAEARFQQTRGIAKALLFDAFDQVSRVPGSTAARHTLAQTGLAYLRALAADDDAPLDVRLEAANGFIRLSKVAGGGEGGQLGKYEDANALLARAETILLDLRRRYPHDPRVRQAHASLLVEQSGANLYNNNEIKLAREQAIAAQSLIKPTAAADPESARIFATAVQGEADSYGWDEDYQKARTAHLRAEAFIAGLPPAMQTQRPIMMARSGNLRLLGEAHHNLDQHGDARRVLDRAVAVNRHLLRADPHDPVLIRKLATSLWYRAVVHRTNMRDRLARESIEEAVANARLLRDRDPSDAGGLSLFAVTSEVQAQVLADQNRFKESYAVSDQIMAAHRRLVELAGNAPGALRSMATALSTRGGNFYNGGDYRRACDAWREARGIFLGFERRKVLTETDRNGLGRVRNYLAASCDNGVPRAGLGKEI
jgi:serine/threonine-protein kinase